MNDMKIGMTISYLLSEFILKLKDFNEIKIGDIRIEPRRISHKDPRLNSAKVYTPANPEGFYINGNGDIAEECLFEILLNKSEKEQDQWVVNTFGLFRQ